MSAPHFRNSRQKQPEFMVRLGLSPPYALDDVKAAYRVKAKQAHPDQGGSVEDFRLLQEAFERANEYLEFRGDRRTWIADQMDGYLKVQEAIAQLEKHGATVISNAIDWLEQSFGDFAQLTESITGVRLENSPSADAMIATMLEHQAVLGEMTRLELPGCEVSDESVLKLEPFSQLKHLDLSGTPITEEALWIVDTILGLESLNIENTKIGWWMKRKVRGVMKKRHDSQPATPFNQDFSE